MTVKLNIIIENVMKDLNFVDDGGLSVAVIIRQI